MYTDPACLFVVVKEGLELAICPPKSDKNASSITELDFQPINLLVHCRVIPFSYLDASMGGNIFSPALTSPEACLNIPKSYPQIVMITAFSENQELGKLFRTYVCIERSNNVPKSHVALADDFFEVYGIEPLSLVM